MTTSRESTGRDYTAPIGGSGTTGLPWRDGAWFIAQVDRHGVLTGPERAEVHEAGDQWAQHTTTGDVCGDLYAASWALVAALRERHTVDAREPLPTVVPVDLDALVRPRAVYSSVDGPGDLGTRADPRNRTPAAWDTGVGTVGTPTALTAHPQPDLLAVVADRLEAR